jgi:hypothetical protein
MTVKKTIGSVLRRVLPPQAYREIETRSGRREAICWLRQHNVLNLALKVAEHFEYTVQCGPFLGMRYIRAAVLTHHSTPNLLGTSSGSCIRFSRKRPTVCDLIIDIGSAEGYFAVGLARLTGRPVVAFDMNGSERQMVREMAAF